MAGVCLGQPGSNHAHRLTNFAPRATTASNDLVMRDIEKRVTTSVTVDTAQRCVWRQTCDCHQLVCDADTNHRLICVFDAPRTLSRTMKNVPLLSLVTVPLQHHTFSCNKSSSSSPSTAITSPSSSTNPSSPFPFAFRSVRSDTFPPKLFTFACVISKTY